MVLWMWIPRYLAVLVVLEVVVVYGVGGLDDVTFVGDVHGLAFLWAKCISQSDSHRCRASRSSWGH